MLAGALTGPWIVGALTAAAWRGDVPAVLVAGVIAAFSVNVVAYAAAFGARRRVGTVGKRPPDWPWFAVAGLLTVPSLLGALAAGADWGGEAPELLGPAVLTVWVLTGTSYWVGFRVRRQP